MLTNLPTELISPDVIHPDPNQPRTSTNLEQFETLKLSVAEHGIIHPLLVRPDPITRQFILITGENRWLAAKELGLETVPCRIVNGELSAVKILTLQILENLIRQDLNPLDEARSLKRLQELENCTQEQLAAKVHLSKTAICRAFKLLDLPTEIQSLVELSHLPVGVALELHACTDPAIQLELARQYAAGGIICEDVTRAVRQANAAKKPDRSSTLMLPLAKGMWFKVPSSASLKQCEQALSTCLQRLREAKRNTVDLETFAASLRTENGVKPSAECESV